MSPHPILVRPGGGDYVQNHISFQPAQNNQKTIQQMKAVQKAPSHQQENGAIYDWGFSGQSSVFKGCLSQAQTGR